MASCKIILQKFMKTLLLCIIVVIMILLSERSETYLSTLRKRAFTATITVLSDIRTAPMAGLNRIPTL